MREDLSLRSLIRSALALLVLHGSTLLLFLKSDGCGFNMRWIKSVFFLFESTLVQPV